jgi:ketosteroid isomerase-like protein
MTAQRDEDAIRTRVETLIEAVRAMDLDSVKQAFAPDVVSFDIVAPLRHVGAPAKWQNWVDVFTAYERPLGYEVRDLTVTAGGDVAFAYSLNHITGTLRSGQRTDMWLRWTACLTKVGGDWLIAHDHVSVPLDMASGKALTGLEP